MNEVSSVAAPAASKPFKLRIDPSKAVAHEGWSAARAQAIAALKTDRKTALLLGPPGVGKTLMLATIAQDLEQRGCRVHLFTKDVPPPGTFEGDGHVMLVDDARRLGDAVLRELLSAPGLCCLLADQPSLEADITRLSPAPLPAPRVIRLAPLSPGQSRRFVAAQVAQSGRSADLLQRDAIELLVAAAGGIPRAICTIGSRAVYLADVHNEDQVGVGHIEKALSLLPPSAIQSATEAGTPAPDAAAEDTTPYALADGAEASAAVPVPEASPKRDGFPFFPIAIGTALVCGALVVVLGRPTQPAHAPVAEAASSPVPAAPIAAASNVRQPQPPAPVLAAEAPHPAAPAEPAALPLPSPGGEATAAPAAALVSAPIGAPIGAPAATLPSLPVYPPAPNAEPAAAALPERRGAEQTAFVAAPPPPAPPHAALPDMVDLPGNTFTMGSANDPSEGPAHCRRRQPLPDRPPRRNRGRMAAVPRRQSLHAQAGRTARRPGDERQLHRRPAIRHLAVGRHRRDIPPADRGRVGICRARRDKDPLRMGQHDRPRQDRLQNLRTGRRARPGARDRLPAQRLRPLRHGRRRGRMGVRLLAPRLPRRAHHGVGAVGHASLHPARAARRVVDG